MVSFRRTMQNKCSYIVSICKTGDDNLFSEVSHYIKWFIVRTSFANVIKKQLEGMILLFHTHIYTHTYTHTHRHTYT